MTFFFFELSALYDSMDISGNLRNTSVNRTAAQTELLPVFVCPSSPGGSSPHLPRFDAGRNTETG